MLSSVEGNVTSCNETQLAKQLFGSSVIPSGMRMEVSFGHSWKSDAPIEVIVVGFISTVSSNLH